MLTDLFFFISFMSRIDSSIFLLYIFICFIATKLQVSFNFTLYPAYINVGCRQRKPSAKTKASMTPFLSLCQIFEILRVEWRNSTQLFVLLLERGNKNNSSPQVEIDPTIVAFTIRRWSNSFKKWINKQPLLEMIILNTKFNMMPVKMWNAVTFQPYFVPRRVHQELAGIRLVS